MTSPDMDHEARTVEAVRAAFTGIPYYAKQNLAPPGDFAGLAALPLLTAQKLRATLPKAWLPAGRDPKSVAVIETGTGDARVRVLHDAAWWRAQESRALGVSPRISEALAGEWGPWRDSVLWVPERGTGSCGQGDPEFEERLEGTRLHLNPRQDPTFWTDVVMTRMLDELARHETVGLFADPFYLDVLARHAAILGRRLDVKSFIGLMRARATSEQRAAIKRVYRGPVLDVYAAREAGVLFVEGDDGKLHHAPFSTHVELLPAKMPTPGAADVALVVVTTLDREVQPLVRYVLGDLVQGKGALLDSVEGKLDDAIVRPDGAIVTAGAVDRALAPLELRGYQLTQTEAGVAEIEVIGRAPQDAADALASLLQGMRLGARAATSIAIEASGKYRTTRRAPGAARVELASSFEGVPS